MMADEEDMIKIESSYDDDDTEEEDDDDEKEFNRPESPRTTAARYLLDLANFDTSTKTIANTPAYPYDALSVKTWTHDKSHSYIEECGLPFTSDQMIVACRTLSDLTNFLANYELTEEQIALCYAAYRMGKGNNISSNSPGTTGTEDAIEGTTLEWKQEWNHRLIHVLDHSYASMNMNVMGSGQTSTTTTNTSTRTTQKSITTEDASYSSDGGASSTGSNVTDLDLSASRYYHSP